MPTLIVLAMHGVPPNDFPGRELGEYFHLHSAVEAAQHSSHHQGNGHGQHNGHGKPALSQEELIRYHDLEGRIRDWPRTEANDPFYAGSLALAKALEKECGQRVLVGFNEFCAPSLEEAFQEAAEARARRVLVITPMMTSGGSHAEKDIPVAIRAAGESHPEIEFIYAWPFGKREVAGFLAAQVTRYLSGKLEPIGWR
ncbi:MAG TPA: CbiX/SirB N-terminal domain-containing protein [Anaerolineales bacterium]|nr:CbiX/SirB N-terminal domain-containing protein [Anaerolineales bacterium]